MRASVEFSKQTRRYILLFLLFLVLIAATRLPVTSGQLYSFDEVNMVYAMDKLDIRQSQPQPPGYPLFILEMRALRLLRVVRPESNLIILAVLGSAAAMTGLVWCGDLMFGGWSGLYGALLLWLYPGFWFAGITSALRVQLALISVVVGGACWRAWRGDRRWPLYSAVALGLGAGIRPEIGPLLFPLWLVGWIRSGATRKERAVAVGALVVCIFCWLIPLAWASGGLVVFFRDCLAYLTVQSATTSSLFGLEQTRWLTNTILFLVWTFSMLVFAPMLWILALGAEDRIGGLRWTFLAVWLGPSVSFAALVHVGDPGHTLAMVAPLCLWLGHQVHRAVSISGKWRSFTWNWAMLIVVFALAMAPPEDANGWRLRVIGLALLAAFAARVRSGQDTLTIGPVSAAGLILLPIGIFFTHSFLAGDWRYATRPEITATRLLSDVKYAFYLSSYQQVRRIVDPDDVAIQATRKLADDAKGRTVILSESSLTSWRKVSHYLPFVKVVVLEQVRGQVVATEWLRSEQKRRVTGSAPLTVAVPAGARLVWMVRARSDFEAALRQSLPVTDAGPVSWVDLPATAGSQRIGDLELVWTR